MAGESGGWDDWLGAARRERERSGLQRRLSPRGKADGLVDLAGNDYLGLSTDPEVTAAAAAAAQTWGAGAAASRLVTGTTDLHVELETALADYTGQPEALVLSTGYHANLSLVTALADRDTLVVSDAHVHASLIDAVRLSRADVVVSPHGDVAAVDAALATRGDRRALVLVESVYSVLGDAAPLADLAVVCERHGALVVVDEAHGLGVRGRGRGLVHELGLHGLPHVLLTCTLSKALGSQGGAVLAPARVIDHLVNRARPFIFDTGLAPAAAAGALAALHLVEREPHRVVRGHARARQLAGLLGIDVPDGWVMSVPMPSPAAALAAQADARERGVAVGCFRPPSVPDGVSRVRLTINAGIPDTEWARALLVVAQVVAAHR